MAKERSALSHSLHIRCYVGHQQPPGPPATTRHYAVYHVITQPRECFIA
jgi:hypothetical protein